MKSRLGLATALLATVTLALAPATASAYQVAVASGAASVTVARAAAAAPSAVTKAAAAVPAAATNPTDKSKVPHYFGPYPNWANSPQVLSNAIVTITASNGDGTGAEATAAVVPKTGAIGPITVTSPGTGYTAVPNVVITSPGVATATGATATAAISPGVVTSIAVAEAGFGFTTPAVTVAGGGSPSADATAVASGGVDDLKITSGGGGYDSQPVVEFGLPDAAYCSAVPAPTTPCAQATGSATKTAAGVVDGVTVESAGSGYTTAPTVNIWNADPKNALADPAVAVATIAIGQIDLVDGGAGYDSAPTVTINDSVAPLDKGASATAKVATKGAVTDITVTAPGTGYLTPGLKKFVDTLATGTGQSTANSLGQYIPQAVPDTTTYPGSDYYEIGVVQYRQKFHSDLPETLLRGYVQIATDVVPGAKVQLTNANLDPAVAATPIAGRFGVDNPHYLGPTIVAQKNRPTRVLFRNLLPAGVGGDLFLPVDTSMMGSGAGPDMMKLDPTTKVPMDMAADEGTVIDGIRNPMCADSPKPVDPVTGKGTCYSENRANLHLHGGVTPWISDGTPHQWITPDGENTAYPKGVSVKNVPDMPDPGPGAQTFFYTNQQSARLMWTHDHSWGITRLNVYAGEAAGYLLTDDTEKKLIDKGGALEGLGYGTPLIVQDKTFVPSPEKMAQQDPTWDAKKWGGEGSFWAPHVYMPAQNPGDPSGMSSFGRWMYGPWFWPPAKDTKHAPIDNPYFDATCDANVQPFCEPALIPGTPNVSVGMEAFNDTPIVNGTAYPKTTVDPKAYRYRILNGANDRFWNLSWYVADPTTGTLSEVALKPAEVERAQTDPVVFPTPDETKSPKGPSWVQIGTEGGFLPTPVVQPAQPTTWVTDPTRFDVGNVDGHSLSLAPAERADVVVDFSAYRGKTLILYNDAPAAYPARVPGYDYYTGGPDLSPSGAPTTLPGYGPNTRTIMQVKVSSATPATAFDRPNTTTDRMGALNAAFKHQVDPATGKPAGVFESGQDPIIVGQSAYNESLGTNFSPTGWCNSPTNPSARCDGFARIAEQGGEKLKFDTLGPNKDGNGPQVSVKIEGKGIHDEMNSANFDEWGRMTANIGLEAPGATPLLQNIILYPFSNPATEILDATKGINALDVTPISATPDGTQIWKITHNGVDTHPLHFHLNSVQVLNRVTWDNIIMPPDPSELGWKETVKVSPLQDTIIAVRPIAPTLPFGVPDSIRPLNPMMPLGARGAAAGPTGTQAGFNNTDANGNPIAPIINAMTNMDWEYVWHCHILSHEEMDMMRPISVKVARALPTAPVLANPSGAILNWTDGTPVTPADYLNAASWTLTGPAVGRAEVGYKVQRAPLRANKTAGTWVTIGNALANATSFPVPGGVVATSAYRVIAWNAAGDSISNSLNDVTLTGFTGIASTRVLDTKEGTGAPKAKLGPAKALTFTVPGLPAGATSVALNVTATDSSTSSFLTVYQGGGTRPGVSNLNFVGGQTIANLVVVPLGPGDKVTIYNDRGTVDVIADVIGFFAPGTGGTFTGKTPARALDTRIGVGAPRAKLGAGRTLTLAVPGLPAGATAVAMNVTVTNPTLPGYITAYPGGSTRPRTSSLNVWRAGQTVSNMVLVPLGPGGKVTFYNRAGTVDLLADVVGSFNPATGGGYTAMSPTRVLDTRTGVGAPRAKLGAGSTRTLIVPGLPAGTKAVALNVTATNPTAAGFLTVYPGGSTRPLASNLSFAARQTIASMVMVPVGLGGKVVIYNSAGTTDVLADLVGSFN